MPRLGGALAQAPALCDAAASAVPPSELCAAQGTLRVPAGRLSRPEQYESAEQLGWGSTGASSTQDGQRLSGLKLLQRPVLLNERLRSATEQLRRFGFVNYFGQQRLGGSRRSGPEIGRAIITQDYELACELIVCSMHEATSEFQEAFRAGRSLEDQPAGRSFTSDLWNRVLGRRLSAFGSDVLPGDLVYDKASLVPEHRGPPKVRRIEPGETALITDVLLPIAGPREWHENLSVLMRQIYQEVLQAHRVGRRGVGQASLAVEEVDVESRSSNVGPHQRLRRLGPEEKRGCGVRIAGIVASKATERAPQHSPQHSGARLGAAVDGAEPGTEPRAEPWRGNGQSQDAVGALGGGGWVQRTTEWVRKAIDTVVIFF
eukprot:g18944.t1